MSRSSGSWVMDVTSNECKLARDIVIFIMGRFYIGYDWKPSSDLVQPVTNSPFTPEVKNTVLQLFIESRLEMHETYERKYGHCLLTNMEFENTCLDMICSMEILCSPFRVRHFLGFCVRLTCYAARSFLRGAKDAPEIAMAFISQVLQKLRRRMIFTEDSWKDLQNECECVQMFSQNTK